jgi:hypothetical protein
MEPAERILFFESELQAQLLDALLTERGIPHLVRSYHDSAYDGVFQGPRGWGHLEAPGSFRDQILALAAEMNAQTDGSE